MAISNLTGRACPKGMGNAYALWEIPTLNYGNDLVGLWRWKDRYRILYRELSEEMQGGAVITGNYRYLLWREWNNQGKTVSFIMLNPNSADASLNDPTITRCINFALSWGYGRLEVVNLFAYRTSKPSLLKQVTEPIGKDNDRYVVETAQRSDKPICEAVSFRTAWLRYASF